MMQHTESNKTVWNPVNILKCSGHCKYAIILLNRPIYWKYEILLQLWEKAQVTVTVDGGTHRWLKYLEKQGIDILNGEYEQYIPNLITGDMDSCPPFLIEKLKIMGSTVIKTSDQSNTDYTKALLQIAQHIKLQNIHLDEIYVLAETSGRFDHIIGNISTLYKSDKFVGNIQVIHMASNSLTWILKPGSHKIHIPELLIQCQSWCALLPFGCPVNRISTTGLKWNLNNSTMQIGGLISTSNTYDDLEVNVYTDTSVIWSMGIEPFKTAINEAFS